MFLAAYHEKKTGFRPLSLTFFILVFLACLPVEAHALPFFSRQIGRDCTYCHTIIPKLNETGRTYKSNGYRFAAEGEWKEVRDWTMVPVSVEIEAEGAYSRIKSNGVKTTSSDLKIEEVEIAAGGAAGKTGRVSAIGKISFSQTDAGTATSVTKAFVQVNDLAGPAGEGAFNVRAGQWDLGLPFLNPAGAFITNRFLAETTLNILTLEQKGIEVNGIYGTEGERLFTHRYSLGLAREDVNNDDKLKGYYGTYSVTFNEAINLGAIFRGGREKNGARDASYRKYGVAAEADGGPLVLTLAYFKSDRSGLPGRNDALTEFLYKPFSKVGFGGRYEFLRERGRKGVKSQSIMARYSILSNVYAQLEFRGLSDKGRVSGSNEDESKVRVFLTAVF